MSAVNEAQAVRETEWFAGVRLNSQGEFAGCIDSQGEIVGCIGCLRVVKFSDEDKMGPSIASTTNAEQKQRQEQEQKRVWALIDPIVKAWCRDSTRGKFMTIELAVAMDTYHKSRVSLITSTQLLVSDLEDCPTKTRYNVTLQKILDFYRTIIFVDLRI